MVNLSFQILHKRPYPFPPFFSKNRSYIRIKQAYFNVVIPFGDILMIGMYKIGSCNTLTL